jgi:hypothetical protein
MRVNIYSEEITHRIEIVEKTADTGTTFVGLRLYLKSPPELHSTADDDDTSAVTFWATSHNELRVLLADLHEKVLF